MIKNNGRIPEIGTEKGISGAGSEDFTMKIMANRMDRGFFRYQQEFESKALEVLRSGWYVLGNEVKSFE